MSYKTNADFVPSVGEYNNPKIFGKFVETLGYKSIKQQIQSFDPQAGNLTDDYFDSTDDDPEIDPTLAIRDMDLAEIGAEIVKQEKRLTGSAKQAERIQQKVEGVSETDKVEESK